MKYVIASDIHGNGSYCNFLVDRIKEEKPDKVVLLGDLYGYDVKLINGILDKITAPCVRVDGNCDGTRADTCRIKSEGSYIIESADRRIMFTHGHIYNRFSVPPFLVRGDVLVYGHTHVPNILDCAGILFVNVGSVGLPREDSKHTYAVMTEEKIEIKEAEYGDVIVERKI